MEIIDGVLLSDGWVPTDSNGSDETRPLLLEQKEQHRDWVVQVAAQLQSESVPSWFYEIPERFRRKLTRGKLYEFVESARVRLSTPSHNVFKQQLDRWYPNGEKIVPKDVRLTPLSIAHWYWGDGCTAGPTTMQFCTDSFTHAEVAGLAAQLKQLFDIGSRVAKKGKGWTIFVTKKRGGARLRDLIAPYVPACFYYKIEKARM